MRPAQIRPAMLTPGSVIIGIVYLTYDLYHTLQSNVTDPSWPQFPQATPTASTKRGG